MAPTGGRRRSARLQNKRTAPPIYVDPEDEEADDDSNKKSQHVPAAREDTTKDCSTSTDNVYSPINHDFYARQPYQPLGRFKRSIQLLEALRDSATGERTYTLTDRRPLVEARDTYTAISYCGSFD